MADDKEGRDRDPQAPDAEETLLDVYIVPRAVSGRALGPESGFVGTITAFNAAAGPITAFNAAEGPITAFNAAEGPITAFNAEAESGDSDTSGG